MKNSFELIFNPFFYIPVMTFIFGQAIKVAIHLAKGERLVKYLFASGGMPSVHTATVVSLAVAAVVRLGAKEPISGVLVIFAFIVIYDSFGVRRSAGELSITVNRLIADLMTRKEIDGKYQHLREILGHKPEETAAGALLGLITGWALSTYPQILAFFSPEKLFGVPPANASALRIYLIIFGSVLVAGVLLKIWYGTKKNTPAQKKLHNKLFILSLIAGTYGLLYAYVSFEGVGVLSFPIWLVLGVLIMIVWGIRISAYYFTHYKHEKRDWQDKERKEKWLA